MRKVYISICLSLLSMKGLADTKPILMYSEPYQYVNALSPNGKWACGALNDGTSEYVAFIWNIESNEIKNLGTGTVAYGVSNDGTVVGTFPDPEASTNGAKITSAGYWKDGQWHHLVLPDELKYNSAEGGGVANCISGNGRFIGGSAYNAAGTYAPVVWDNGIPTNNISDKYAGSVYAVTDDGSKAGGWTYTKNSGGTRITVMWDADGNQHFITGDDTKGSPFYAIQKFSTDGNEALYEKGIYNFTTGQTTIVPSINPEFWSFVLYDFSDSTSVVGYEQTLDGAQFPIIYRNGKTEKLEDYLISQGVDFAADGMVAQRLDGEGQYNLMIARSISKNDSVMAFTFVDKDYYLRSAVVKLNQNCSNPEPVNVQVAALDGLKATKLTWKAPLLNSANVKGYNVYRNGEKVNGEPVTATSFYDTNLATGSYEYYVTAEYNDGQTSEASEKVSIEVNADEANAPYALYARMKNAENVLITWNRPLSNLPTKQYYSNDDEVSGFGGGNNSFEAAIRYDKAEMQMYKGYKISAVKFVPREKISGWDIDIYKDKELIYTQHVDQELNYGKENTVTLTTPVDVPQDGDLYIAVKTDVPASMNSSNIIGMVYDKCVSGYSDLVRLVTEDEFYSLNEASKSSMGTSMPITWAIGATFKTDDMSSDIDNVANYNVYRDSEMVGSSETTNFINETVPAGDHKYEVEAVYANGAVSPKAAINFTAVTNTAAFKSISDVNVSCGDKETQAVFNWTAPVDNDETVIEYCGKNPSPGAVGSEDNNYGYMAKTIYSGDKLLSYNGYDVKSVRFYPTADADFTVIIKKDGEEIVNQYVENYKLNEWNTVNLETPFAIDENSTYDLIIDCFDVTPDAAPLALDGEAAFTGTADLYSLDEGATFSSTGFVGNWMMGLIATDPNASELPVEGYDVRIDGTTANTAKLTEPTFTYDFSDGADLNATHKVNVDVYYSVAGKVEGSAVFFTLATAASIDSNFINDIKLVRGDNYIRIEGEGVTGVDLYAANGTLINSSNTNVVNISGAQTGTYVVKAKTANGSKMFKMRVSK
ncbi:rhamnogalacturonan endolyase family protein [Prevotella sp.]|uniref:rhamnogalacturonan endolyase family protein n=1 Tax=Prevotella sp. TaxID=59823 RepID=UPI003AB50E38